MSLHPDITALIEEAERTKQRAVEHGSTDLADRAQQFIDDLREKGAALADVDQDSEANQVVEEAKVQLAHLTDEGQ
jgi:F0F1-type ATP synthase membrane subunit b/b'